MESLTTSETVGSARGSCGSKSSLASSRRCSRNSSLKSCSQVGWVSELRRPLASVLPVRLRPLCLCIASNQAFREKFVTTRATYRLPLQDAPFSGAGVYVGLVTANHKYIIFGATFLFLSLFVFSAGIAQVATQSSPAARPLENRPPAWR